MDISTIGFLIFGFAALIGGFVGEGGNPAKLLSPTSIVIILGGTIAATGISYPLNEFKKIIKVLSVAFKKQDSRIFELIAYFKNIAFKTRKEGLLSIEELISGDDVDPFVKKGLQMVVDGIEPQTVKGTLELSVDLLEERHELGISIFESAGGYSPTMGIIGTVMGLVNVLANMTDTATLGEKISGAFIATLYGIMLANLFWLPIAGKLKRLNAAEINEKQLIVEAILCIQEGVNPNTLEEKLKGFLDKKELEEYEKTAGSEKV